MTSDKKMLALTFSVGKGRYALDVRHVIQVIPRIELQPVAHAPEGIAGMFDYEGRIVPVIDLGRLFGGEPCPERLSTRIILTDTPKGPVGLIAERVTELREVPDDDGSPAPIPTSAGEVLGPIVRMDDGLIQLVRVGSLGGLIRSAKARGGA